MLRTLLLLTIGALVFVAPPAQGDDVPFVWWEAESPRNTSFPHESWFSPRPDEVGALSGGNWLTNMGNRDGRAPYARYVIDVPETGRYELWTRKFWVHGPFRWRFDREPWQECGRDVALADNTDLRTNVTVNWVHLGEVDLEKGEHTFFIELLVGQGEDMACGFDCFCLSLGAFTPNGRYRPGEVSNLALRGWFAVEPPTDTFGEDALLDLRGLNEARAGQSGFVDYDANGNFTLGDGTPVRFWAVNVGAENAALNRGSVHYLARRLAKLGVNMVRYHAPVWSTSGEPEAIDHERLDQIHYFVHALKQEGIYTTISFYFPVWLDLAPRHGMRGYDTLGNKRPFGVVFFDERFQQLYLAWLQAMMTTENPYSGTTLARDPAVALVELVNEDSLFFWTFAKRNIPEPQWTELERDFGRWLVERYGSVAAAQEAWDGAKENGDTDDSPRAILHETWWMTREGMDKLPHLRLRMADQVRYLAGRQRGFYASVTDHLRDRLDYGGLVVASNWKTADPELLDMIEHYTYTAADVIDRHAYFDPPHEGDASTYAIRVGQTFEDRSVLHHPEELPLQFVQVEGRPHIMSELCWTNPNRFRAEGTILSATYGALQSIDGLYFFAQQDNAVRDRSVRKYPVGSPIVCNGFPAAALLYRRGDVSTPDPVEREVVAMDELFAMKPTSSAAPLLDALRRRDAQGQGGDGATKFDRRRFLEGPVVRRFAPDGAEAPTSSGTREGNVIVSANDELRLDVDAGVLTIDTPRAQGAVGFLGAQGRITLADVEIDCRNEYAAIVVISLDDEPLASSQRILIQASTEEKLFGFTVEDGRITDLGQPPFNIREIDATVHLPAGGERHVQPLDPNGYAAGPSRVPLREGDHDVVVLDVDRLYHVAYEEGEGRE